MIPPVDPAGVTPPRDKQKRSLYPFQWYCGCVLLDAVRVKPCPKHEADYGADGVPLVPNREECPRCHRIVARYGPALKRHKVALPGGAWCPGKEIEMQHD